MIDRQIFPLNLFRIELSNDGPFDFQILLSLADMEHQDLSEKFQRTIERVPQRIKDGVSFLSWRCSKRRRERFRIVLKRADYSTLSLVVEKHQIARYVRQLVEYCSWLESEPRIDDDQFELNIEQAISSFNFDNDLAGSCSVSMDSIGVSGGGSGGGS